MKRQRHITLLICALCLLAQPLWAQTELVAGAALEHHCFTRIWVKRDGRWQLLSNTQFIDPNKK